MMCLILGILFDIRAGVDVWCILYYYILYIYYYSIIILYIIYYILYSSPSFSSLPPFPSPIFYLSLLLFFSSSFPPPPYLIQSIRVGIWIHLFIFNQYLINNLTPHVLSEWMVEVCRFEVWGVLFRFWCSELV